ncbi:hypothetical protein F2Q70_00017722 [Brassica cretica]|uniref:Uncharacterized protein n=1 Tax=Brassica cretica TaxID=69181 RepID=A0A8S9I5W5_BRACR|nr:hypothetical protein F2Q70_00017722 [Brassica cretica]
MKRGSLKRSCPFGAFCGEHSSRTSRRSDPEVVPEPKTKRAASTERGNPISVNKWVRRMASELPRSPRVHPVTDSPPPPLEGQPHNLRSPSSKQTIRKEEPLDSSVTKQTPPPHLSY